MANVRVDFEVLKEVTTDQMREEKVKPGFKYIGIHMIFDIKMDGNFARKSRLVACGHNTAPPFSITYSIVVTRESVRLEFLVSGLRNLYIYA